MEPPSEHGRPRDQDDERATQDVGPPAPPSRPEVAPAPPLTQFFSDSSLDGPPPHPLNIDAVTAMLNTGEAAGPVVDRAWWPQLDEYEIEGELGRGGMGVVYRARHKRLRRVVALKMLAGAAPPLHQLRRFRAEAEAIARLRHPNIIQIFEVGQHRGQPFFALELAEGGTLRHRIDRRDLGGREAVRLIECVARAVHHAHSHGIVHRDLKPGNILLTTEGEPRITDFGVAKLLDSDDDQTRTGSVIGTPDYMSPEQASGRVHEVGPASDIYALGVILYELLSGSLPITGETHLELVQRVIAEAPVSLSRRLTRTKGESRASDLDAICDKCLEKEPHRRYGSALALADDLARWQRGEPVVARPVGAFGRVIRWCRRKPLPAALTGLSVLLVLILALAAPALWMLYGEAHRQREAAQEAETEARTHAARAAQQEDLALQKKLEADHQVARLCAANGARQIDAADYFRALVWTAEALDRETRLGIGERDSAEQSLRLRTAALLEKCPALVEEFDAASWVSHLRWSDDGRHLTAVSSRRDQAGRRSVAGGQFQAITLDSGPLRAGPFFSDDGLQALIQQADGGLRLCDLATGKWVLNLAAAPGADEMKLVAWRRSPDGKALLAQLGKEFSRFTWAWSMETGALLDAIPHRSRDSDPVLDASFSRDSSRVMLATRSRVEVRNLPAWSLHAVCVDGVLPAALSPDGKTIAAHDGKHGLVYWNVDRNMPRTASRAAVAVAHRAPMLRIRFSHSGRQIATSSDDAILRVWDAASGDPVGEGLHHQGAIHDLSFSPDDRFVLALSNEGVAQVWDIATGIPVTPSLRHGAPVVAACWRQDGRQLATAARDGSVRIWDLAPLAASYTLLVHDDALTHARFSPRGDRILTASADGTARLWDAATGRPVVPPLRHAGPVTEIEWSRDGRRVLTLSGGDARVWDTETGKPETSSFGAHLGNKSGIHAARFSPDGRRLYLAYAERVNVFDRALGRDQFQVRHSDNVRVEHLAVSPSGRLFATAEKSDNVRLWRADDGAALDTLTVAGDIRFVGFLADERLAVVSTSGLYRWDGKDGALRKVVGASGDRWLAEFRMVRWDTAGRLLVIVGSRNNCQLCDAVTGDSAGPVFQPGGSLRMAAVLPQSGHMVTVRNDGEVRLWDGRTAEPLTPPHRLGAYVADAELAPDGKSVVTAGIDGKARIWRFPTPESAAPRELQQVASWLGAERVDAGTKVLETVTTANLRRLGAALDSAQSSRFEVTPDHIINWHRQQADAAERAGQLDAALFHLRLLQLRHPENNEVLERKAEILLRLQLYADAVSELSELIRGQSAEGRYLELRARAHARAGNGSAALQDTQAALKLEPANGATWLRLSLLHAGLGNDARASTAYRQALALGLDLRYDVYFNHRERDPQTQYQLRRRWQPILEELSQRPSDAVASRKYHLACRRAHGLCHAVLGDWTKAREQFIAVAQEGDDAEAERALALADVVAKQWDAAAEHSGRAVDFAAQDGSLWYLKARLAIQRGGAANPIELDLTQAIDRGADHADSRRWRGVVRAALGDHRASAQDLSAALRWEPAASTWFHRGESFVALGLWEPARGDFDQAALLAPTTVNHAHASVLAALHQEPLSEESDRSARQTIAHLLATEPLTVEYNYAQVGEFVWVGVLHREPPASLARWLPFLEKAVEKLPASPDLSRTLGAARLRLGQLGPAFELLQRAIKLDPDGGTAWDWRLLAIVHAHRGEVAEAQVAVEKAALWLLLQQQQRLLNPTYRRPLTWMEQVELQLLKGETRK